MYKNVHWSVKKGLCLQKIISLGFPRALYKEGSVSQPLGALKGSGYCLEALLHLEGRQLAQRLFFARRRQNYIPGPVIIGRKQIRVRIRIIIVWSCALYTLMQCGRSNRRSHIWRERDSPYLVPTHHQFQQGDVLASGYPASLHQGSKRSILRLEKKRKFFFIFFLSPD